MTNCPNCGAVITGPKCEYCGTVFKKQPDLNHYISENVYINNQIAIDAARRAYINCLLTPNELRRRVLRHG